MGVPDFELYYLVAQLSWLSRWTGGRGLDEIGMTETEGQANPLLKYILGMDTPPEREIGC